LQVNNFFSKHDVFFFKKGKQKYIDNDIRHARKKRKDPAETRNPPISLKNYDTL
jgi:hypothetical protein